MTSPSNHDKQILAIWTTPKSSKIYHKTTDPGWLIHWKIKNPKHPSVHQPYLLKQNNECSSINSACFFFPWLAPKKSWKNPTLSNFNPMLVVFPGILFSGLRNNPYNWAPCKPINKQVPFEPTSFAKKFLEPQACNKGSHDLGTNEWMDSEPTDGSKVRKNSKVGGRWLHGDRLGWLVVFWWV